MICNSPVQELISYHHYHHTAHNAGVVCVRAFVFVLGGKGRAFASTTRRPSLRRHPAARMRFAAMRHDARGPLRACPRQKKALHSSRVGTRACAWVLLGCARHNPPFSRRWFTAPYPTMRGLREGGLSF